MSSVVVLQTIDRLWIGADTAVSATLNDGTIYRLHELGQKLFVVDDMVIFCSGVMKLAHQIMTEYTANHNRSLNTLKEITKDSVARYIREEGSKEGNLIIDILIGKFEHERTAVYSISPQDDFELRVRVIDNPMNFAFWTGGIKVQEANDKAMETFQQTMNINETFQQTFDHTSYEGIGGELIMYQVGREGVSEYMKTQIKEKPNMKRLNIPVDDFFIGDQRIKQHLVIAEAVIGQLGNFVTMEIGKDNDITKINTNGISAGHADMSKAPFQVNMKGDVIARSIKLTGQIDNSVMNTSAINAGTITGTTISGSFINGGTITGTTINGGTINVTTDINVGNNIVLNGDNDMAPKSVIFTGVGRIDTDVVHQTMSIKINGGAFIGSSYEPGNRIATLSDIFTLQTQITALQNDLASKSDKGHTHTVSTPHNHGNPANIANGEGPYITSADR